MLGMDSQVFIPATRQYGTVVDWLAGDTQCDVVLDSWQGLRCGGKATYELTELQELVEADEADKREAFDTFDALVIDAFHYENSLYSPRIVIRRQETDVRVTVKNLRGDIDETKTLEGSEASGILSSVLAMHADTWTGFMNPGGTEGGPRRYSWSIDVYSANRHFSCAGADYTPPELVDVLFAISDAGMPLAWDGSEMRLPVSDDADPYFDGDDLNPFEAAEMPVIRFEPMTYDEAKDFFRRGGFGVVVRKDGQRVPGCVFDFVEKNISPDYSVRYIWIIVRLHTHQVLVYDNDLLGVDVIREPREEE